MPLWLCKTKYMILIFQEFKGHAEWKPHVFQYPYMVHLSCARALAFTQITMKKIIWMKPCCTTEQNLSHLMWKGPCSPRARNIKRILNSNLYFWNHRRRLFWNFNRGYIFCFHEAYRKYYTYHLLSKCLLLKGQQP